jgi:hypothetical protein
VQAAFDLPLADGAYAFTSLRKYLPLDASVAYFPEARSPRAGLGAYRKKKRAAQRAKDSFLRSPSPAREQKFLFLFAAAEALLQKERKIIGVHAADLAFLRRLDWKKIRDRRRANHQALFESLGGIPGIKPVPGDAAYGIVETRRRDDLRRWLFGKLVFSAVHWPDAWSSRKDRLLSLPIDQRYGARDMRRMAALVREFFNQ